MSALDDANGAPRVEGVTPAARTGYQGSEGAALAGTERDGATNPDTHSGRPRASDASGTKVSNPSLLSRGIGANDGDAAAGDGDTLTKEKGERAARSAAAALLYQNRNNSTGYRMEERPDSVGCLQSPDGRTWVASSRGALGTMDRLTSSERKAAFQLRGNIDSFVRTWGAEHCGFWTLTDLEGITPREFARRWNSLLAHHGEWVRAFIRVLEPQLNGNPHYHLLVSVAWDMRPGDFDWDAFRGAAKQNWETRADFFARQRTAEWRELRRRYVSSSAPETVALWKRLRRHLERYGLGRSEFVPVRKVGAITEYVGKYLEAGVRIRIHGWKGARRVETDRRTSQQWKTHGRLFSWYSPHAREWRKRVHQVALMVGALDLEQIADHLGPHWAYWIRGYMTAPAEEWTNVAPLLVRLLRDRTKPTPPGVNSGISLFSMTTDSQPSRCT